MLFVKDRWVDKKSDRTESYSSLRPLFFVSEVVTARGIEHTLVVAVGTLQVKQSILQGRIAARLEKLANIGCKYKVFVHVANLDL